jgi:sugar transferase (PEP-CTERM/EpsH1 system associated)
MQILYLSHRIPYPPNKGDKIRSFNEIKYLSQRHEIDLACLADDAKDLKYENDLRHLCKSTNVVLINPKIAKLKSSFYLFSKKPLSVPYFYSKKLQQTIDHLLSTNDYDAIFCFSSPMAEYVFKSKLLSPQSIVHRRRAKDYRLTAISHQPSTMEHKLSPIAHQPSSMNYKLSTMDHRPRSNLIMDFVDVDSDKWAQYARYVRFPKSWIYRLESKRLSEYEKKVAESFDHSIFVTQAEVEVFKKLNPHIQSVIAISNGVDLDYFSPNYLHQESTIDQDPSTINHGLSTMDHQPRTIDHRPIIVFTGAMDYYANIDGVVWFAKEILPFVKKEIPEVQFYIVGSNPAREVQELENNAIKVTGYVDDIRPYYQKATISVVPLRIARGIQNKILEAMAMAKPVITTSKALEGINAIPEQDLLIGDSAGQLIDQVTMLLRDEKKAKTLGGSARRYVEKEYSWQRNMEVLNRIFF